MRCKALTVGDVSSTHVREFHSEPRVSKRPIKGTHGKEFETITRIVAPSTASKELETIKAFFRWLVDDGTLTKSPAAKAKPPIIDEDDDDYADANPMPFSQEEIDRILDACDKLQNNNRGAVEKARKRGKALVYTFLYSGLRISDVAAFARKSTDLNTGRFSVKTIKSRYNVTVRGKLVEFVCQALRELPVESPFFFTSGNAKPSTARGSTGAQ